MDFSSPWLQRFLLFFILTIDINFGLTPEHVHLSLSNTPTQMNVVWYTEEEPLESVVEYGTRMSDYSLRTLATSSSLTYGAGNIHRATMRNLTPASTTYYRVGSQYTIGGKKEWVWSKEFSYRVKPNDSMMDDSHIVKLAAYGDMGVFPTSFQFVKALVEREVEKKELDFILHAGDLAYGFGNFTKWNMWFDMIQDVAAFTPYMTCPGNRDEPEITKERFTMPLDRIDSNSILHPDDKQNFYYSFDYAWVHVIAISIKDDYSKGSTQWIWLENDLKQTYDRINNPKETGKWIFLLGHTPLYSSSNGHTGGNKELKESIEELLHQYHVSIAMWGDDHVYERSYPMYNNEIDTSTMQVQDNIQTFIKPNNTIHLLIGTSGIEFDGWLEDKPPSWSAYRERNHGYVKMEVGKDVIRARFVRKDGTVGDEFVIVRETTVYRFSYIMLWSLPLLGILAFFLRKKRIFTPAVATTYSLLGKST